MIAFALHLNRKDVVFTLRNAGGPLLDPDLAAQLLKEGNPANRAALSRKAKAYLGNEASTLTDILDGNESADPVKGAIMR